MAKKMHDILPPKKKAPAAVKDQKKEPVIPAIDENKILPAKIPAVATSSTVAPKIKPTKKAPVLDAPSIKPSQPQPPINTQNIQTQTQYEIPKPKENPLPSSVNSAKTNMKPKKKIISLRMISVALGLIVLAMGIFAIFKLPKADIEIWPMTSTLNLNETIAADMSVNSVDLASKTIPLQQIQIQKSAQQNFPATGSSSNGGTASGIITLYNKTGSAFNLLNGTHFLSDSGIYFVGTEKITIPAQKNGTPGFVNITVQAQDAGADSNIGPSNFSLPKLSGTSYYKTIYGASTAAMTGGFTGSAKIVTDDDISGAQDVLTKQLFAQAEAGLKSQLTADDVVLDNATSQDVVSANSSVASGGVADTFNEQASVQVSALVFKKSDVESIIENDLTSQLGSAQTFLASSITANDTASNVDMQHGKETLAVQASVVTYSAMNTNTLAGMFSGKSADQIKQIMDQMYSGDISQLKINFWPFWVTHAPSNINRIKVNLNF